MVRNEMVDNNTYNIMQAFVSTLEALEAFQKYSQDGNEQLWQQVSQHTEQVARLLQQHLPQAQAMQQGSQSQGAMSGQGAMAGQSQPGMGNRPGMTQSDMGQSAAYDANNNYGGTQRQPNR